MKITLFGGTFDPIHLAHVQLAEAALRQLRADEVWFLISPQNPWKTDKLLSANHHRLRMAQIAVEGHDRLQASDYEFHLPKPSYTYQTLRHLRQDYPEHEFTLLIGGDNWAKFDQWAETGEILSHHRIAVYPRPGCAIDMPSALSHHDIATDASPSLHDARIAIINAPMMDISSTEIRHRIQNGHPTSDMLDVRVAEYITEHNLYAK